MNSKTTSPRITVVFRNDDPSALSDVEHQRGLFELFERWNIPQTIGVVPNMTRGNQHSQQPAGFAALSSNPAMVELLKTHCARIGSELALHGFTHQTNRFSIPGRRFYFEFARLPVEEQESLLNEGARMVEECTGVRPRTFIAPWNRLDRNTVLACERTGFEVVSTQLFVPAVERLAPFGTNSSLPDFEAHLNVAKTGGGRVFINLLLHTPAIKTEAEKQLLAGVLKTVHEDPDCEALTVLETARRYPEELRLLNRAGRGMICFTEEMDSWRARAHFVAQTASRLRITGEMKAARRDAEQCYRRGDYDGCVKADARLDRWARLCFWGGRAAACVVGLMLGKAATVLGLAGFVSGRWIGSLAILAALALVSGVVVWKGTSPDTRRETALIGFLLVIGWIVGAIG